MARRDSEDKTLKEALQDFLETYQLKYKLQETNLVSAWPRIMGPMVEKYTHRVYINRDTFYVELTNAALRSELSYARDKIKNLLNQEAGFEFIKNVVIK